MVQSSGLLGPYFPRRHSKMIVSSKSVARPAVPELNMFLHPSFLDSPKVITAFRYSLTHHSNLGLSHGVTTEVNHRNTIESIPAFILILVLAKSLTCCLLDVLREWRSCMTQQLQSTSNRITTSWINCCAMDSVMTGSLNMSSRAVSVWRS